MTTTINAQATNGLLTTADGSGIVKLQSNGVATNFLGWVKYVPTPVATQSSYNVSSVTYNTTGATYVTWNIAMADNNHAVFVTIAKTDTNYNTTSGWQPYGGPASTTTSIAYITCWNAASPWQINGQYNFVGVVGN